MRGREGKALTGEALSLLADGAKPPRGGESPADDAAAGEAAGGSLNAGASGWPLTVAPLVGWASSGEGAIAEEGGEAEA